MPTSNFQPIRLLDPDCWYKFTYLMAVQIQISWLLQKPTDLDLHCLQRHGISGFSRTRVKRWCMKKCIHRRYKTLINFLNIKWTLKFKSRITRPYLNKKKRNNCALFHQWPYPGSTNKGLSNLVYSCTHRYILIVHHNLLITLLLESKAKTMLAKQQCFIQTKMYRLCCKMTIYGKKNSDSIEKWPI